MDNLESRRDVTIATISSLVVVIELKKRDSARLLTSTQWDSFHDKLRGHESPHGNFFYQSRIVLTKSSPVLFLRYRNYAVQKSTWDEV